MGLLFQIPVEENIQDDHVQIKDSTLTLKSYGLPYIFWGYLAAALTVIIFMYLAIRTPIEKLILTKDPLNVLLGWIVALTLFGIPTVLISFYFYEKRIQKKKELLTLSDYFFGMPIRKKIIQLKDPHSLEIGHFLDSPNVAKIRDDKDMKAFANRGHYELYARAQNDKTILIDRNSRPGELKKLKSLLSNY
jgi:hypothetical protein